MSVTTFDSSQIDALRRRAENARAFKGELADGWSKSVRCRRLNATSLVERIPLKLLTP